MNVTNLISAIRNIDDDLNQYRMYWETNSDWNCRKQFLAHNWKSHDDKEKLISLSCAWANVRFLGNYYPIAVMKQLKEMEEGLKLSEDKAATKFSTLAAKPKPNKEPVPLLYNPAKLPKFFNQVRFVKSTCNEDYTTNDESTNAINSSDSITTTLDSIAKSSEDSAFDKQPDSPTSKHKMSDTTATDCDSLTKKLKTALKIPENPQKNATANEASESHLQVVRSSDLVHESSKELTSDVERFAAVIKTQTNLDVSNSVSNFFNAAVNLALRPKFVCGMSNEEHVLLFDDWSLQNGFNHNLTNFSWVCDIYIGEVFLSQGYGKTLLLAKEKAVVGARSALGSSFTVCKVNRNISPSMFALQYGVKLSEKSTFPPVVTIKGAPVIKLSKSSQSFGVSIPSKAYSEKQNGSSISKTANLKQKPSEEEKQANYKKLTKNDSGDQSFIEDLKLKKLLMTKLKKQFSGFVVVVLADVDDPFQSLQCTMGLNKVDVVYKYDVTIRTQPVHTCSAFINGEEVVVKSGKSKEAARIDAATKVLRHLVAYYPCLIKMSVPENSDLAVKKSDIAGSCKSNKNFGNPIAAENIGNQLLRKMGWTGSGGLGKMRDGIAEPVQATGKLSRSAEGLGLDSFNDGTKPISIVKGREAERVIQQYISNGCKGNLTFSSELTSDDRKKVHLAARKYGLKSKSFGYGNRRYLVLFKNLTLFEIYKELLAKGGEVNGYILPR